MYLSIDTCVLKTLIDGRFHSRAAVKHFDRNLISLSHVASVENYLKKHPSFARGQDDSSSMAATPSRQDGLKRSPSSSHPSIIAPLHLPARSSFSSIAPHLSTGWPCFAETNSVSLALISPSPPRRSCSAGLLHSSALQTLCVGHMCTSSRSPHAASPFLPFPRRATIPSFLYVSLAVAVLIPLA